MTNEREVEGDNAYDTSFKTLDAYDYSNISKYFYVSKEDTGPFVGFPKSDIVNKYTCSIITSFFYLYVF